jgi:dihydroxyacetone kinase-like predicted kinase
MSVDVEIYYKNIIHFFETNPEQLTILIGSLSKDKFFNKLRNAIEKNYTEIKEPELTRKQMVDLVWELHIEEVKKIKKKPFEETKYGTYCLN